MARLEDLTRSAQVTGIRPDGPVTVIDVAWHGTAALTLTYRDGRGNVADEMLFGSCEMPTRHIP